MIGKNVEIWAKIVREFGAAGAVVVLAIWVIAHQGEIIRENTRVLQELVVLIRDLHSEDLQRGPR